jgi:hypothetical protein
MIDIVIPTMWMSKDFCNALESYVLHPHINKVIIIDNNKKDRPNSAVLQHSKIELISYGRNIYVNPAWNEGYNRSTSKILSIINDDIVVSSSVFDMVVDFDLKMGDIVGVNLRGYQNNYEIDDFIATQEEIVKLNYDSHKPIGGQAWAFGICMFMLRESYTTIPQLYQVWYGDDYLAQRAKQVYAINSNRIKGKISETLKQFNDPNSDISKRIELDSKNLLRFDHFKNKENWDIPRNMIAMYESQRKKVPSNKPEIDFSKEYDLAKSIPSDINENVHILYDLAKECKTVVEMGVRTGVSTRAFLNTDVELLSFDIVLNQAVEKLFDSAKKQGKNVNYIKDNVLAIEIDDTDLLFIDTLHTYDQLKQELKLHGNKAQKYIAFHDTHTFGLHGEDQRDQKGLLPAIIEFMIENPHWKFKIHKTNNNGFTVLERT